MMMKTSATFLCFLFVLSSCKSKSIPEKVKANKEKFIQVAKENSKPIDINDLADIYEQAKSSNVEGKMKYLGVDNIQTIYEPYKNSGINLDSIVVFTKSDYLVIYDFAILERQSEAIKQNCGLIGFEQIDKRLYIGKK